MGRGNNRMGGGGGQAGRAIGSTAWDIMHQIYEIRRREGAKRRGCAQPNTSNKMVQTF
jgi:hypothetical protein